MSSPIAVITGGSGGIGQAMCRRLLARGYAVVNLDRQPSALAREGVHTVGVDLSEAKGTRDALEAALGDRTVGAFVHNAGVIRPAPIRDLAPGDFDYLGALHLKAAAVILQVCLPTLTQAHEPRIVLTASRAALGLPTRSAYAATKAGLIGLMRTWALELAAEGITVNAIAPGPIAGTEMFHELIPKDSEMMASLAASIPLGRLGTPEDVARALDFFIAPEASFVTGQVLYVCGGASVGSLAL